MKAHVDEGTYTNRERERQSTKLPPSLSAPPMPFLHLATLLRSQKLLTSKWRWIRRPSVVALNIDPDAWHYGSLTMVCPLLHGEAANEITICEIGFGFVPS